MRRWRLTDPHYRNGRFHNPGEILTLEDQEKPSRTWVDFDEEEREREAEYLRLRQLNGLTEVHLDPDLYDPAVGGPANPKGLCGIAEHAHKPGEPYSVRLADGRDAEGNLIMRQELFEPDPSDGGPPYWFQFTTDATVCNCFDCVKVNDGVHQPDARLDELQRDRFGERLSPIPPAHPVIEHIQEQIRNAPPDADIQQFASRRPLPSIHQERDRPRSGFKRTRYDSNGNPIE